MKSLTSSKILLYPKSVPKFCTHPNNYIVICGKHYMLYLYTISKVFIYQPFHTEYNILNILTHSKNKQILPVNR